MTQQGLIYTGIGLLTAIVVYKFMNRDKKTVITPIKPSVAINNEVILPMKDSEDKNSSFCGCGA